MADALLRGAVECLFRSGRRNEEAVVPLDTDRDGGCAEDWLAWSLLASGGATGKHYAWRPRTQSLHLLRLQPAVVDEDGAESDSMSALSKELVLEPPLPAGTEIRQVLLNFNCSRLALVGPTTVAVVDLQPQTVPDAAHSPLVSSTVHSCTLLATSHIRADGTRGRAIADEREHLVQVSWHPLSNGHVAVLTRDGIFSLYDVQRGQGVPEQQFVLQPGVPHGLARVAAFCFGSHHNWERFSIIFLLSDGAIFTLCPVLPANSWIPDSAVAELWREAQAAFPDPSPASLSSTPPYPTSSSPPSPPLAALWLQTAFPDYKAAGPGEFGTGNQQVDPGQSPSRPPGQAGTSPHGGWSRKTHLSSPAGRRKSGLRGPSPSPEPQGSSGRLLRCRKPTLWNACVALQGPARILDLRGSEGHRGGGIAGDFCALACTVMARDSVLVSATRQGQLRVCVMGDEVHPRWNTGAVPALRALSHGDPGTDCSLARPPATPLSGSNPHAPGARADSAETEHAPLLMVSTFNIRSTHTGTPGQPIHFPFPSAGPTGDLRAGGRSPGKPPVRLLVVPGHADVVVCAHGGGADAVRLQLLPFSNNDRTDLAQRRVLQEQRTWAVWETHGTGGTAVTGTGSITRSTSEEAEMRSPALAAATAGQGSGAVAAVGTSLWGFELSQGRLLGLDNTGRCVVRPVLEGTAREGGLLKPSEGVGRRGCRGRTEEGKGDGGGEGGREGEKKGSGAGKETGERAEDRSSMSDMILAGPPLIGLDTLGPLREVKADSAEGQAVLAKVWRQLHETHVKYAQLAYWECKGLAQVLQEAAAQQGRMQAELEESVREQSGSCADLLARAARAEAATESLHLRATRLLQRIACNRQPLSAQEKGIKAELDVVQVEELPVLSSAAHEVKNRVEALLQRRQHSMGKGTGSATSVGSDRPQGSVTSTVPGRKASAGANLGTGPSPGREVASEAAAREAGGGTAAAGLTASSDQSGPEANGASYEGQGRVEQLVSELDELIGTIIPAIESLEMGTSNAT